MDIFDWGEDEWDEFMDDFIEPECEDHPSLCQECVYRLGTFCSIYHYDLIDIGE